MLYAMLVLARRQVPPHAVSVPGRLIGPFAMSVPGIMQHARRLIGSRDLHGRVAKQGTCEFVRCFVWYDTGRSQRQDTPFLVQIVRKRCVQDSAVWGMRTEIKRKDPAVFRV
eukprot:1114249-Rhodomonas_salina.2